MFIHKGEVMKEGGKKNDAFLRRQKILAPAIAMLGDTVQGWIGLKVQQEGALNILEIGTGYGRTTSLLAHTNGITSITTVDPSQQVLDNVKTQLDSENLEVPITYQKGVAEEIPFPDSKFPLVISIMTLHHFSEYQPALEDMFRVLVPGGWMIIADWAKDADCFDEEHRKSFLDPKQIVKVINQNYTELSVLATAAKKYWYALLIKKALEK